MDTSIINMVMNKQHEETQFRKINVAILGTGMMGQQHILQMQKYSQICVRFLCDPNPGSLDKAAALLDTSETSPELLSDEKELLHRAQSIDLLVIASPSYLHTPQLLRWSSHPIFILVETPVAISEKQLLALRRANALGVFRAKVWVAMEYRFIPAIQKLYQLLPEIGTIKNITIRENRFPFLSKIGDEWDKEAQKSGDTLVEECCHFFDLFRLISGHDLESCTSKVHRGLLNKEYGYNEPLDFPHPIIDSAYVLLDFSDTSIGCLELCMYAEGSRHQQEIVVTGMTGRLEAYLPENKVFHYQRPTKEAWVDRTLPPPQESIVETIHDCANLANVYDFAAEIPEYSSHRDCSAAVEWKYLIDAMEEARNGGEFVPKVSLLDGIRSVDMGIMAQKNATNGQGREIPHMGTIMPLHAFSTKSCDHLLNMALNLKVQASSSMKSLPRIHDELYEEEKYYGRQEEKEQENNDEWLPEELLCVF